MLRCSRGQTDFQCWMVRYEISSQKAIDAWLDATTPKPIIGEAAVTAETNRLRDVGHERLRTDTRQAWLAPPGGLHAHFDGIARPEVTDAMRQTAVERVWGVARRARVHLFPISDNLAALMALVMADLSESQREILMILIFQRDVELTALTLQQWREFLITASLFQAPKSSLENPRWAQRTRPRSLIAI